jgi:hypothetical protein
MSFQLTHIFFLERAGELHIFILRRKMSKIYHYTLPFWRNGANTLITYLHNTTQHNTQRLRPQAVQSFGACHAP